MECPDCGYILTPFDKECPRCQVMGGNYVAVAERTVSLTPGSDLATHKGCPRCGAVHPLDAPSCGRCGRVFKTTFAPPVQAPPPSPAPPTAIPDPSHVSRKLCPDCQEATLLDAQFCPRCGHRFQSSPLMRTPEQAGFSITITGRPIRGIKNIYKWGIAAVLIVVMAFLWLASNTADFMAAQAAGRDAYANKLSQMTGEDWGKWRQNADQFDSNVDAFGQNPASVTISTRIDGRKARIGVATVERTAPWHWRPVNFTPDMPPYPTLPE